MAANEDIKSAIRKIVDAASAAKVEFVDCYVKHVPQIGEEGYGTVDVVTTVGKAEITGVSLSAIDTNARGEVRLPTELSEITIAEVNGGKYFAVAYSHLDSHIIDANKSVKIGVVGFDEADDDTDYDEVDPTGLSTDTEYTPESIVSKAIDKSGSNDKSNIETKSADANTSTVSDASSGKSSTVTQTPESVKLEAGGGSIEQTETETKVKASKVTLSNGGPTQNAVLGQSLKTVMNAFIDQVASITTTTAIGPQPIINLAMVQALKGQVDSILSSVNFIE